MKKAASGVSPLIYVDRKGGKPLYSQVYEAFRAAIVDRKLRAGERIPSTRALASELGISRIPVLNAYAQLLAEGYFKSRTGSGTFVSSASRRFQLLEWAESSGSWIIEDDYDSEYRYDSKPIASLQGLDHSSRVIYIGTFSKVLFPSLRVGYIVIPSDLVEHFVAVRHAMDVSPPHLYQAVLADFINEGHFSRHIRRMRQTYGERREVLVNCIQNELDSLLQVHGSAAGLHLTVTLPRGYRDGVLSARAARQNLWLWPLSPSYHGATSRQGFILGFGGASVVAIPNAVRRLRAVLSCDRTR